MMAARAVEQIARRTRRRAGRIGILEAQAETRDALEEAVAAYAALRRGDGTHTATLDVELIDGTPVTALVTVNLVPTS